MEDQAAVDRVIEQVSARRVDAIATLELLHGYATQVGESRKELENPQAVAEYVEFFQRMFSRVVTECERIAAELTTEGVKPEHIATLRQLAGESSVEQRRCLMFRDKVINKPLPYERMRPLLNEISVTTRDQLTAFRDLAAAADRLEVLLAPQTPPAAPERSFDRRSLFTRFIKR